MTPWLTKTEAAEYLRLDVQSLSNLMSKRALREGEHYFKRRGEIGPRFRRDKLDEWMEGRDRRENVVEIRMAKGYSLAGGER